MKKMKLVKTQICLFMYDELLNKKYIVINEIKQKFDINERTLFRYINEIRCYLSNFFKGFDIVYSRHDSKYYLIRIEKK